MWCTHVVRNKWYKEKTEKEPKRVYYCKTRGGGHQPALLIRLSATLLTLVLARLSQADIIRGISRGCR